MSRTYTLDTEAAKGADSGQYIIETGKYVGIFTRAEEVSSRQGTEGVEFAFKSNSGATADFLTLWTFNSEGKELPSFKTLNAIMTCAKARTISPKQHQVEKYDSASGQRKKVTATVYPELMNKAIGVLLQKVWRADKPDKYKFEIAGVFDAETELTASEILAKKTEPSKLAQMVSALKDKHESPRGGQSQRATSQAAPDAWDEEQDIPF